MMLSWKITPKVQEELKNNLNIHFQIIYKDILDQNEILKLINRVLDLFKNKDLGISEPNWSQKDVFLITYGDSIYEGKNNKLKSLIKFLDKYCKKQFNYLHILPFFPYSSDDDRGEKHWYLKAGVVIYDVTEEQYYVRAKVPPHSKGKKSAWYGWKQRPQQITLELMKRVLGDRLKSDIVKKS